MGYDGSLTFNTEIDESGFNSGTSKLGNIFQTGLGTLTGRIMDSALSKLGDIATATINVGSEFEAQMSRVQAISGATGEEFTALREQAIQLGADTSFSASSAAEGMENLAAAGFTTSEIMDAMPGLLDLAAASGEDLANSSDIAASTLRGFGLAASEAGHVADVLAENANRTNSSVADTGEAMKYVAPLARAAGISLEETAAAIGIMANAGIQGSQAGTTLRAAISRLSKPTKEMKEAMQELGISFYDSDGKMKSLSEQVEMLQNAMTGLTDEQKNNYLVTLYGQEALSGMMALINEGQGSLDSLTQAYQTCDGSAAAAAATMQDNFKGAVEQLNGSLETLGIRIYDSISEPLKGLAQNATEIVNQLTTAFQENGVIGMLQAASQMIIGFVNQFVTNAPTILNSGIALLGQFLQGIAQGIPQVLTQGIMIVTNLVNGIVQSLPQIVSQASSIIMEFVSTLISNLPSILDSGIQMILSLLQGLVQSAPQIISQAASILTQFVSTIGSHLPEILQKGIEIVGQLLAGIIQEAPNLIAYIPEIVSGIWDAIMSVDWLDLGINIIKGIASGIASAAGNLIDAAVSAAKNALETVKGWLGINSPSRRFRDEVGRYMALGMGKGFQDNIPTEEMEKSLDKTISDIQKATESIISKKPMSTSEIIRSVTNNYTGSKTDYTALKKVYKEALNEANKQPIILNNRQIRRSLTKEGFVTE